MDSDEERRAKSIMRLEQTIKESEKQRAKTNEIAEGIGKAVHTIVEIGRENYEEMLSELEKYYNEIDSNIIKIKNEAEICLYLREEKRRCINSSARIRITLQRFSKKTYQKIITEKLEPLILEWESTLKIINSLPANNSTTTHVKTLIIEDENLSAANIIEPIQVIHKTTSEPIESISNLPPEFKKIKCRATREQILNFFMILASEKNKSNMIPYMDKEDIKELVEKNFTAFNCIPTNKYFPLNINEKQKGLFKYFIAQFYKKYEPNIHVKEKYAYFLKHNFEIFKNDILSSLVDNMGKTKRPQKYIHTENYFPK